MVEELISSSSHNNHPSSLDSQTNGNHFNNNNNTNQITTTQNHGKDVKIIEENGELKDTGDCLVIDHVVETSNNSVLRMLLRRQPRYFDTPDSDYGSCYNCGEAGHTITNCGAGNRKKPCYLCGSLQHNAKQCKQRKECFYCKKVGHYARNCPQKSIEGSEKVKTCLRCGDSGHEFYSCKTVSYSEDDLKEIQCYICKCMGHLCCVDYGEGPSEVSCYRCGQLGHSGLKCSTEIAIAHAEASPSYCYKCGQEGHKPRKCKTFAKRRRRKNAKPSNLQDSVENVGVRSPPQELSEACKRNKTQHEYSTSSQPKRRGGWMDEHDDTGERGSLSTPASYKSNNGFHGNHGSSSDYTQ